MIIRNTIPKRDDKFMSVFDQRGQNVTNQSNQYIYNAGGNINFGDVQNQADLVTELEKLKSEITKAGDAQIIESDVITDVQYQLQKALDHAKKPDANKNIVVEYLNQAKGFIKGIVEAGGIVSGITKAIELVQKFF